MNSILFHMVLPPAEWKRPQALYFRGEGVQIDGLHIPADTTIRFDTYFNGFYYSKYLNYTIVDRVIPTLAFVGTARVRVLCRGASEEELVLFDEIRTDVGSGISLPVIPLTSLPLDGVLFFELTAMQGAVRWVNGVISTAIEPIVEAKVAVVICTYQREEYVLRNLNQLKRDLWSDALGRCDDIDVLVIDNGMSLPMFDHPRITVFPNKNYGGSGGFARGILEAYRRRETYTHVLLMDDDISFESESLYRTTQLLKFAKSSDKPLCIGGQMLIEDRPTIQFESGGFFSNGYLKASNQNLDLKPVENLLINTQEAHVDYNAWWYCCFPLCVVEQIGLPLPFFIKTDDVEYGVRMKPDILLMNGIGVWHTAFSSKYSPHLEYYIKRNELIASAIHQNGDGIWRSMWKLIRSAGKSFIKGEPGTIKFLSSAYIDFLKGPKFLLNVDAEQLNIELIRMKNCPESNHILAMVSALFLVLVALVRLAISYHHIQKAYILNLDDLTSLEFWSKYLELKRED